MRWPRSPLQPLTASTTRAAARVQTVLNAPLRRPRITTRRLMLLVAVVAVALWGVMYLPDTMEQAYEHQRRAAAEALKEDEANDEHQRWLTTARRRQAEHEEWRRRVDSRNPLTARYLNARDNAALTEARYQRDLATYHSALKRYYGRAAWMPWLSHPTHLRQPRHPGWEPASKYEPGKIVETVYDGATTIAFSPASALAALGRRDQTIRLLEPQTGEERGRFSLEGGWAHHIVFSPDGQMLATAGFRTPVQLWDVRTRREMRKFSGSERLEPPPYDTWHLSDFAFTPDGKSLIVALRALAAEPVMGKPVREVFAVRRFDIESGAFVWDHEGVGEGISGLACSPDGTTVALAHGNVTLLDLCTGQEKTTLKPVSGYVLNVAFSPDGQRLAGAGSNLVPQGGFGGEGRVTVWNATSGAILHTLNGPSGRGQQVAFAPNGRSLATVGLGPKQGNPRTVAGAVRYSERSEVRLFDSTTGSTILTTYGESGAAHSLSFSPDGKMLGFCDPNYCYLIDSQSGKLIDILAETTSTVRVREHPSAARQSRPEDR